MLPSPAVLCSLLSLVLVPAVVDGAFIEKLAPQKIAADGNNIAAFRFEAAPVYGGGNRIFAAYMDITPDPHNIYVLQYDYGTGQWTRVLAATTKKTGGDGHNSPTIYRDAAGYLLVFYGAVACGFVNGDPAQGRANGPCYRVSVRPDDISAWGPELRVPLSGAVDSLTGGLDSRGTLHIFGQAQANSHLSYIRRDPSGAWTAEWDLVRSYTATTDGSPGCAMHARVAADDSIHLVWGASTNGCSGAADGLNYARSVDGGETWRSADGSASFTRAGGLSPTSKYEFPAAFRIRTGGGAGIFQVDRLDDGTIVVGDGGGSPRLWSWTGAGWTSGNVDPAISTLGMTMRALSNGALAMYNLGYDSVLYEHLSLDKGATWRKTSLYSRSLGEDSNMLLAGSIARPPGEAERVHLAWNQRYNGTSAPPIGHTEIMFLDRVPNAAPAAPNHAPGAPRGLRVRGS